jgi:predicted metalloendopeptidase
MRLFSAALRLAAAVALCAALGAARHAAGGSGKLLPEPFDAAAIDRSADACKNFFGFATGRYRAAHPIPPAYVEYGYIEELVDRTRDIVHGIVTAARAHPSRDGSNEQKLGTFYGTCMDTAAIERHGSAPIRPELDRIAAITDRAELPAAFARLGLLGVDAAFALNPTPDIYDSKKMIAEIEQGGLGLPERDYYLRTDADSRKLRIQYTAYVQTMLRLGGDAADARRAARAVVELETRLARGATPVADLRDPAATYHPMTVEAIATRTPRIEIVRYLNALGVRATQLNIAEPAFLSALDAALALTPLPTWKSYLRWRLLDTFAPALPARFEAANFAFRGRILDGAKTELPRWKRCVNAENVLLGEAVGERYVALTFPPAARRSALAMALRIKHAYRGELEELRWMTPATKRTALAKLDAMGLKVGYPKTWRSYAGYAVRADSYYGNTARGQAFERRYELAQIGRPVNRAEWDMTPQTVNAYNDTQRNEIVLPAAQLQRPFYDPAAGDPANFGATGGGTIGHEITHGFDDEGRKLDVRGNLRNWWTPSDQRRFNARAQCVINQFDSTTAVGTIHYTGRLVAGEAIADLGGVVIGYRALETALAGTPRARLDGFTPEQRYFLSFAQSWSESIRPEAARTYALTDPHPLPRDRVNITLANVPEWYAAFDCPQPSRPVCEVW